MKQAFLGLSAFILLAPLTAFAQAPAVNDAKTISIPHDEDWKKGFSSLSPQPRGATQQASGGDGDHNLLHPPSDTSGLLGSLRFCAAISDKDGRLSCYDGVSSHNGIEVNQTDITAPVSEWVQKDDPQKNDYIAALSSSMPIHQNGDAAKSRIILYVRCTDHVPSLYFKTGDVFDHGPVTVLISNGIGKDDAISAGISPSGDGSKSYTLQPSVSGDAFGIWSHSAVRAMSDFLANVPAMRLTYLAKTGDTITARFDLSQFKVGTHNVRTACDF